MGQAKRNGANREERIAALLEKHSVKVLTPERYNAFVAWTRHPAAKIIGRELEYFSTLDEYVIGVLILDQTDRDYGYVALGRDEKGRFRFIHAEMSMNRNNARRALFEELKKRFESGVRVFPQGDESEDDVGIDLFTPIVNEAKLSPSFQQIRTGEHWLPARSIIAEMMRHLRDVDGNLVEQFQTTGFDARIWELYLYAALLEEGLHVEKPDPSPDFMVSWGERKVFIEAVTVNPSDGDPKTRPEDKPIMRSVEEMRGLNDTKIPIKYGSSLWSKLNRAQPYWEMERVAGNPLVFAIADFHEKRSMTWSFTGLLKYLYGVSHDFSYDKEGRLNISPVQIEMHEYEGKKIPSGFFLQPKSENISAVLFSASGTISKFNRMGRLAGFGLAGHVMMRSGFKYRHDHNAALPELFHFEIKQGDVTETWAEGLEMFHNPNARHPVDHRMFPNIAHHRFINGQIVSHLPEFHPFSSYTWNFIPKTEL